MVGQYAAANAPASGFPPLVERPWTGGRSQAGRGGRRCPPDGHPALRGHLGPLLRARRHRGPADGPRRALVRDRHAHRRGDRARARGALGAVLRAAAQGRRLLEQRRPAERAVRRRRPRGQAHPQADRPPSPGRVAAPRAAPRPHPPARRDRPQRRRGRARDDRAALRARGRHRAQDRALGVDRGRRSAASTSTGTAPATRTGSPATRSRCSAASSAWPRPPRCSSPPAARAPRSTSRPSAAAPGSTPRSSTRCARRGATTTSGRRSAASSRTA